MPTRSLGSLTLDLIAKIGGFTGPLDQAGRKTKKWSEDSEKHAKAVGVAIGAAAAASVGALAAMAASTIRAGEEISRFAAISNTSTTEFQKLSAGAGAVGVSQEKLADIFKDVNDKVGDFLNTGGGELKDFFTNIAPLAGVTADQFRKLSGPEALGLFVSSLEKAGAGQADMTFYLESIADDATLLLPLLKNNAEGFKAFGAAAEAAGAILDDKTIKATKEMSAATWLVEQSAAGLKNQISSALLPTLATFANQLDTTSASGLLGKQVADDLAGSFKVLAKFALGSVAGIHLLGQGLKTLSDLDDASMKDGSYWEKWVPPARMYRTFQNFDNIKETLSSAGVKMDETAQGYAALLESLDKPADPGATNQVRDLADLLDKLRNSNKGTLHLIPPDQVASAKKLTDLFGDAEAGYRRQIALINTSTDAQKNATEVDKLRFEVASGKLVGINAEQQKRLEGLAAELDSLERLKIANEDASKLSDFGANLKGANQTIKQGFEIELAGAGSGDKLKERLKADLQIQQEYDKQVADLFEQRNSGKISQDIYGKETALLEESLAERMVLQQDYYNQLDEAQTNWLDGVNDAWANFADSAQDYSQIAADMTSTMLDSASGNLSTFFSDVATGAEDASDALGDMVAGFGKSMVNALSDMAAQWLVYQAVQLLVGKTTQSTAGLAMVANAQATSAQAALAAYASTAAIPIVGPALAPGAALAAQAATIPMVGAVSSAALAGMAHDGMSSIPREGTWLLDGGERVVTPEQNKDLTRFLDKQQDVVDRVGSGSGGVPSVSIPIHITVEAQPGTSKQDAERTGATITEAVRAGMRQVIQEETQQGGLLWRRV